jgi:hypothetical protein
VPGGPVPDTEISKIIFDDAGNMLLAERGGPTGAYDFGALTAQNSGRVLRLRAQQPGADGTPFFWAAVGDYAIGFPPIFQNGDGGIAIGYGYEPSGLATAGACGGTLWTTGSQLRISPDLPIAQRLAPGGPFPIDGLQGNAVSLLRPQNTPPFSSYFIDFDDRTDVAGTLGHMGDVIVWRACQTAPAPVIAEYIPLLLELAFEDVGCPAGTARSGQVCLPTSCRADEIFRAGKCDKPECESPQLTRGGTCCPQKTSWNPRTRTCEPRVPGKPDLQVVKTVKDKNCGQANLGDCSFEVVVTNVGDAPYTGPIAVGDIMIASGASVTGVSIPAGFTCSPIPITPGSGPSGGTLEGCISTSDVTLAPAPAGAPIVFRFNGSASTSRSGWRNCAVVFGKLPSLTYPGNASNAGGPIQINPASVSGGSQQRLIDALQGQNAGKPSVETNLGNNKSCISSQDDPKLGGCTPVAIAMGNCGTVTSSPIPTTSCPSNTVPFNGMCCTRKEIDAGTCGGKPTTSSCPSNTFAFNDRCCTRKEIADGKCGGTLVTCPPDNPLCNQTRTSGCLDNALRIDGKCPVTGDCGKGQFRGDDGKCQKSTIVTDPVRCGKGQFRGDDGKCQNQKTGTGDHPCETGFSWDGRRCVPSKNTTTNTSSSTKTSNTSSSTKTSNTISNNSVNNKLLQNPGQFNRGNVGGTTNSPIQHSSPGLSGKKF